MDTTENNLEQLQRLTQYLQQIIHGHRLNSSNIPTGRLQIFVDLDYSAPLRVEVFWQKDPDLQLLYFYHPKEGKDLEIVINGPYNPIEINKKLPKLLEEIQLSSDFKSHEVGLTEMIVNVWTREVDSSSEFLVMDKDEKERRMEDSLIFPRLNMGFQGWVCTVHGNILDVNQEKLLDLLNWKLNYDVIPSPEQQEEEIREIMTNLDCFGTFIHPPYFIGEIKKPSTKDLINNKRINRERIIETKFEEIPIIVENDGLIVIGTDDSNLVKRILNALMGFLLILGYRVDYVGNSDIFGVTLDSKSLFIRSWSYPQNSKRLQLAKDRNAKSYEQISHRESINSYDIELAVNNLLKINNSETENLIFLSSSYTHLIEGDFSQSFINSWVIIEKTLFQYGKKLSFINKNDYGTKKLTTEKIINLLGEEDHIENTEDLHNMRKIRNSILHEGHTIILSEAKKALDLATMMIKQNLNYSSSN